MLWSKVEVKGTSAKVMSCIDIGQKLYYSEGRRVDPEQVLDFPTSAYTLTATESTWKTSNLTPKGEFS